MSVWGILLVCPRMGLLEVPCTSRFHKYRLRINKIREPCEKEKYWSTDNAKIGIEKGSSFWKNGEISWWKAQIDTQLNWFDIKGKLGKVKW